MSDSKKELNDISTAAIVSTMGFVVVDDDDDDDDADAE